MRVNALAQPKTSHFKSSPVAATQSRRQELLITLFLIAHIPLGMAFRQLNGLGMAHVILTLTIGLIFVVQRSGYERVMYVAAYIAGSEVLWRMTKVSVFWEIGKYAISFLLLLAILRSGRWKSSDLPFIYFVLLLPSAVPVFLERSFAVARSEIAFNLSGPFALMVCVWFFSRVRLTVDELNNAFLVMLAPLLSIAFLGSSAIASGAVQFDTESNAAASGGYSGNQVSSILGLGFLCLLLFLLTSQRFSYLRTLLKLIMLWLAGQSIMTFSRGGMYNTLGAMIMTLYFLIKDTKLRMRFLLSVIPLTLIGIFVLFPFLNDLTDGNLEKRFESTKLTGRDEIMRGDLHLWEQYPLMGVGPGISKELRDNHYGVAAHTEYTRMLAEHGVFGLYALILLVVMTLSAIFRQQSSTGKAVAVAMTTWSLLFMTNAGMRLAVPSFVFGLAWTKLRIDLNEDAHP